MIGPAFNNLQCYIVSISKFMRGHGGTINTRFWMPYFGVVVVFQQLMELL
jgi:hypothetical protein